MGKNERKIIRLDGNSDTRLWSYHIGNWNMGIAMSLKPAWTTIVSIRVVRVSSNKNPAFLELITKWRRPRHLWQALWVRVDVWWENPAKETSCRCSNRGTFQKDENWVLSVTLSIGLLEYSPTNSLQFFNSIGSIMDLICWDCSVNVASTKSNLLSQ